MKFKFKIKIQKIDKIYEIYLNLINEKFLN